ncbi:hypothetical protein OG936_37720 [Streptomyces sp. NBC_00846]|uniref:hypothetical protein n=1 Tax=Streptomyces sp. NBC_00846 TaxID=2975849 RepID=UPI00386B0F04|nr:hypothetical protein OG936_37720 [Streptomyces sp. NBC_00846]
MAKKKRTPRYSSPNAPTWEKRVQYISSELRELKLKEFSELSPDAAREMERIHKVKLGYKGACGLAALAPEVNGWGLIHCTIRDKRGRRARMTLATNDLTYHHAFTAAAGYENPERVELAVARYPFKRPGWPGPIGQGGSWPSGDPVPWRATYRNASPDVSNTRHLHGGQVSGSGATREICAAFVKGPSGAKFTMIDDAPVHEYSKVVFPESAIDFFLPAGVSVIPGWPSPSAPGPCPLSGCE